MAQPFSVTIFSTSGDPEGIRIIEKSNWSGIGVCFPRSGLNDVLKEEYSNRPGVYVLVGDAAEETIYIGEADPISARLKQHIGKEWSWGVFFADTKALGKTEVQYLESELVRIAKDYKTSILMNKNTPNKPNMSRQLEATAKVFLSEMLLIMPIIGIRAFSPPKIYHSSESEEPSTTTIGKFDTLVVPAQGEGFTNVFLAKNCWYAVRIQKKHIPNIKYIAAYQTAPISAITHVAEVKEIVPYMDSGKYLIKFKGAATKINPVTLKPNHLGSQPQSPRYTTKSKLDNSKYLHELWAKK